MRSLLDRVNVMAVVGHLLIVAFGVLGATAWSTASFAAAGPVGDVISAAFVLLGAAGAYSAALRRGWHEVLILRAESVTFGLVTVMSTGILLTTSFTQWQGVVMYAALGVSLGTRSRTMALALRRAQEGL